MCSNCNCKTIRQESIALIESVCYELNKLYTTDEFDRNKLLDLIGKLKTKKEQLVKGE